MPMTKRQRLDALFARQTPDRTPILGGWIACPDHIAEVAGVDLDTYWEDPHGVSIRAYELLGMDGLIGINVPKNRDDFRIVDHDSYLHADKGLSLEAALAEIEARPGRDELEEAFEFEPEYARFRAELVRMQQRCGDMVWMPAQWSAGARVTWYGEYGYENFFLIVAGYPDHARKLMEIGGAIGYNTGRLVARAVEEGLYPHAIFFGEDICTQRGPMVSPRFLEEVWLPQLAHGIEPLQKVGCNVVWHSDGDIRPMVDMLLSVGIQGFQGFQPECGMTLEYVTSKRTREGNGLIIFGPLSVTTELPVLSPQEVKERVWRAVEMCGADHHLALFTANTINPDVPLENIRAMYEAILEA